MTLKSWLENKWVRTHQTSKEEIRGLISSAEEDIKSAQVEGIASGWRLNMAYTALLRYATIAMYVNGYQAERNRKHERTIESIRFTVPKYNSNSILILQKIRQKRHQATYDSIEAVSKTEAESAMKMTNELGYEVLKMLRDKYPEFL
jgi:hypothetical protein